MHKNRSKSANEYIQTKSVPLHEWETWTWQKNVWQRWYKSSGGWTGGRDDGWSYDYLGECWDENKKSEKPNTTRSWWGNKLLEYGGQELTIPIFKNRQKANSKNDSLLMTCMKLFHSIIWDIPQNYIEDRYDNNDMAIMKVFRNMNIYSTTRLRVDNTNTSRY